MPQSAPPLYPLIRARIADAGLFRISGWRELPYVLFTASLYTVSFLLLAFAGTNVLAVIAAALVLAVGYGQAALLGHDMGHIQVIRSQRWTMRIGALVGLAMGFSTQSWVHNHNLHHAHANREHSDPDIDFPIVAFSDHQVLERTGWRRWFIRRQHWFFPVLIPLLSVTMRVTGGRYLLSKTWGTSALDRLSFVSHFLVYFGVVFGLLWWPVACLFVVAHHLAFGAYIGMIFAPNHKGMEVFEEGTTIDFVREQVLTCRNITPGPLTDLWYGCLNYQVEHHLFPSLPRGSMREARVIVKRFCAEHGLPYHETTVVRSYGEIFHALRDIALYARSLG
jgi:fatty acid desaturase